MPAQQPALSASSKLFREYGLGIPPVAQDEVESLKETCQPRIRLKRLAEEGVQTGQVQMVESQVWITRPQ
jgi:hypothetical protein